MKLHRFIGKYDLSKNEVDITDPKIVSQIKVVLRLKKGDKIILSDGKGNSATVIINFLSDKKITCIVDKIERPADAGSSGEARKVNLYLAILKKENFELATQKAVECGISNIIPVITERTIKTGLNISRLEKIILEASEQSGRNIIPTLSPILEFKDAIANASGQKIIFHLVNDPYIPNKDAEETSIFIGPEGGFTEKEIDLAKNSSFKVASLGSLTLRGETAAIIGTYRAVHGI